MPLLRLVGTFVLALVVTGLGSGVARAADPQPARPPALGADPSTWAPVSITPSSNSTVLAASLGQALVLTGFPATSIVESSNTSVATPIQGTTAEATTVDGVTTPGATTNPGLQTLAVGATLVVVFDGPVATGTPITRFIVQVASSNGKNSMLDREPMLLDGTEKSIALNETGERLSWAFDRYTAVSDNEAVMSSIGYPGRQTLTAVGYGTARVIVSQAGKELARLKVTVTRAPRFEFRIPERLLTAAKAGEIVNVTGRLAQRLPMSIAPTKVCAFHVTPRVRLGCATTTPAGDFTIPAKAKTGTAVVEYKDAGGGKGSAFLAIEIDRLA